MSYYWKPIKEWTETKDYYECDGVFAKEGVQAYPERNAKELKPWEELKKTATLQSTAPLFPGHPKEGEKNLDLLMGEAVNLHPDPKNRGIAGTLKVLKSKAKDYPDLEKNIRNNAKIRVSVGWRNKFGSGGKHQGESFDRTQKSLLIDHVALLFQGEIPRCPDCGAPYTNDAEEECPACEVERLKKKFEDCPDFRAKVMAKLVEDTATYLSEDYDKECVEAKIPIIRKEHPEMEMKQVVAIAISKCREKHGG